MNQPEQPQQPPKRKFDGGAGILVLARDTGRLMTLKRSDHVHHGRTWALTGGLIDPGETPLQAAQREMREETNYTGPDVELVKLMQSTADGFTYTTYIAVVDKEYQPALDHENEGFKWVDSLNDWPRPAHFGIEQLKQNADAMRIVNAMQKEVKDALAANPPALQSYPPTLYHVEPKQEKGEDIPLYKGKVHASENPREALASLAPKDVRIVNKQLPGSEDFVVIIEDRDNFLKNGKFEGVVNVISGENFKRKPAKDGSLTSHWVAANPVPVNERTFFDKIRSVEDAMYYGVHILFTPGPASAEQKQKIRDAVNGPDFPNAIKEMVKDGTLIYENALRDINVSPEIEPGMTGTEPKNKPPFVRRNRSMKPKP